MKLVDLKGKEIKGKRVDILSHYEQGCMVSDDVMSWTDTGWKTFMHLGHDGDVDFFKAWGFNTSIFTLYTGKLIDEPKELEDGKVYKYKDNSSAIYMKIGINSGYGFNDKHGFYSSNKIAFTSPELWQEYPLEDFKNIMILEAERRYIGQSFYDVIEPNSNLYHDNIFIYQEGNVLSVWPNGQLIGTVFSHNLKKWADVETPDEKIAKIAKVLIEIAREVSGLKELIKLKSK